MLVTVVLFVFEAEVTAIIFAGFILVRTEELPTSFPPTAMGPFPKSS